MMSSMRLKPTWLVVMLCTSVTSVTVAGTCTIPDAVTVAVGDTSRPPADTAVDAERKPAQLLAFAGIKPGDRIADLMPGKGYFTRLFSALVGPQGHVYAVVPAVLADHDAKRVDPIKEIMSATGDNNISMLVDPYDRIDAPGSLDVVWTSLNYHDVYGGVGPFAVESLTGQDAAEQLDVAAFKALKAGGIFIVIDHAAKDGDDGSAAKALHRMNRDIVISQAKAAGFQLMGQSDVLRNVEDPRDKSIFSPEIRGHTDKFVFKFIKPGAKSPRQKNCP